jgi:hypothetical protein
MLKISKPGPNRVDVEFSGKLDAEAMKAGLDELITQSEDVENGRMLYRIGGFRLPTLGALGIELSRLPSLLRLMGRFDRCAVLADQDWIRAIAELEGKLMPGFEIRGFEPDEEAAAEAWLAEDDAA